MNKEEYFKIISTDNSVLHIEWKGFWNDDIAHELGKYFVNEIKEAVTNFNGERFIVLADFSELKVLTDITKEYLAQGMKYTLDNGLIKGVEILSSTLSKMSVKGAARQTGEDDFRIIVENLEEAQSVIGELKEKHNL